MESRTSATIFISYARSDRKHAQLIAEALEANGWSVWWDRVISAGKRWRDEINNALEQAKCVLVLWSSEGIRSDWVRDEAQEGLRKGILIPVQVEDVEPPYGFRGIQTANLIHWDGQPTSPAFNALLNDIVGLIGPPSKESSVVGQNVSEKASASRKTSGITQAQPSDLSINQRRIENQNRLRPPFRLARIRLILIGLSVTATMGVYVHYKWAHSDLGERPYLIPPRFAQCVPGGGVDSPAGLGENCTRIIEPKVRVYNRDMPLDYCHKYAIQCGPPNWDRYCKRQGFARAVGGERAFEVGESYIFGDGSYVPPNFVPSRSGETGICTRTPEVVRCDGQQYVDCIR